MNNGLQMKYFVLKPAGDSPYHAASRKAMRAYARHIQEENVELASDLLRWADDEALAACEDKEDGLGSYSDGMVKLGYRSGSVSEDKDA